MNEMQTLENWELTKDEYGYRIDGIIIGNGIKNGVKTSEPVYWIDFQNNTIETRLDFYSLGKMKGGAK